MYGSPELIIPNLIFFAIILIGVYLSKFKLRYIGISILGIALFSVYLPLSMQGVIVEAANIHEEKVSLFLKYIFPVAVFCLSTVAAVRWGEQRQLRQQNSPARQPLSRPDFRKLHTGWTAFGHWFTYKENIVVCVIAALIFAVHLVYIARPPYTIGDEHFYVTEANRILHGQPLLLLEHPPLGKWFIAAGMFIFGNNAVGWRVTPIIFGTASIFIFYLICQTLVRRSQLSQPGERTDFTKPWASWFQPSVFVPVLATFLFASDTLSFSQAQVAMLDVFSVTLMLLGFLFYLRGHYISCGIAMGLGILCKETAIFGVFVIILHWAFTRRCELANELRFMWRTSFIKRLPAGEPSDILRLVKMILAILATWFLLLPLLEYIKTPLWGRPFDRIFYIYWHTLILLPGSGFQTLPGRLIPSPPWQWLVQPNFQDYNFISPHPRYEITIGWTIWALIVPSFAYLGLKAVKAWKNCADIVKFTLFWFVAVYGSLIVTELSTRRPMYTYYFYPAITAVCLAIAWSGWELRQAAYKRAATRTAFVIALSILLIGSAASFIIMSPIGTNLVKLAF